MQSLVAFFTKLWAPSTTEAERLGFAFMYDEEGNLLSETGTGGANSTGSTQYIYLPTSMGAMPVAVIVNGQMFAVHSDHLNTPRRITNASGQVVWQWSYSAFGEDEPTNTAKRFTSASTVPTTGATSISPMTFNLGYMGQYRDAESGLAQNWNRYYDRRIGRYTQPDPIGLDGGFNQFIYANSNPLSFVDPDGLQVRGVRSPVIPFEGNGGRGGTIGGGGNGGPSPLSARAMPNCGPSPDALSRAAGAADKGGFTFAGRSLQKRGSRPDSRWNQTDVDVNKPSQANLRGQDLVDDLLTAPGSKVLPNARGGFDAVGTDGRTVRFNRDGSMQGLRE